MSKNIFLYQVNENNNKYIKFLNENLPNLDYNLKNINLSFVYNKYNQEEITKLHFSANLKLSLVKINLSFCAYKNVFASIVRRFVVISFGSVCTFTV